MEKKCQDGAISGILLLRVKKIEGCFNFSQLFAEKVTIDSTQFTIHTTSL